jgi:uncharacterized protein (TIGR03118 family)
MRSRHVLLLAAAFVGSVICAANPARAASGYTEFDLVSDILGLAAHTDANLVNPWGMASSATSPIWVSDNGTGVSTLYNGAGIQTALVVTIPSVTPGSPASPTGIVFNGSTTDFTVAGPGTPSHFIFATEDGTISGWNTGTNAVLKVDNSAAGAIYKGLAIGNNGAGNFIYATNFSAGTVEVYNASFSPVTLTGTFTDPGLPAGFAPFGIQNIGGVLFVTYAMQDVPKEDDVPGPGNGYVNRFSTDGLFLGRFASAGVLNSPWGLALAPSTFGDLAGAMLVGNFGDGKINGFNPVTGAFIGVMNNPSGNPIVVQGLWALLFGNGGGGGLANDLFFTAGIPGPDAVEDHGLFGRFVVGPSPALPPPSLIPVVQLPLAGLLGLLLAAAALAILKRRRR